MALGTNRVVIGSRPMGGEGADGGSREDKMAVVDQHEAIGEPGDVMMTKTKIATTTATVSETETEAGALAKHDKSDPAQWGKVIDVDHCGAGDWR
jgi:hypothetical protein